ncbi:MAG: 5-formyltetrahydrofolate cyclo-ligase [Candidatus Micrarchaeota archaeon]
MSLKNDIRNQMRELLSEHPIKEAERKSASILDSLQNLRQYKKSDVILTYVSTGAEVSTRKLILDAFRSGKRIVVPAVKKGETGIMTIHEIRSFEDLCPGHMNIPEPKKRSRIFPSSEIDLAVVPGLAFDERGHRLGKGGAFFDRFLKHVDCQKVALAFEFQVIESVPTLPHDVPVDSIITEKRIINVFNVRI